jgi:voltage-gated potassium channel
MTGGIPRLVRVSYRLDGSERYGRVKRIARTVLSDPHSRVRPYFDIGMMLLVLASVVVLLYEVKNPLPWWGSGLERFAVSVFIVEYLARMWVHDDMHRRVIDRYEQASLVGEPFRLRKALWDILRAKWRYVSSPLAIIDLLAIIPSYRPLRFLRIFLLFRLFKLFRYARSVSHFGSVLRQKRVELSTLFGLLAFIMLVASSAIYLFERPQFGGQIEHFFDGVYWALVTVTTLGYGDISPATVEGRVIAMVLVLSGAGVLAFFTSIIVSAFQERLPELRENRVFADLERHPGYTVICGFGRIGQAVAARLAADGRRFVVVDDDPRRTGPAEKAGYLAVTGPAERVDLLQALGVGGGAQRILCLTGSDVVNVYIALIARQMNSQIEIIARADRHQTVGKLRQAGADHVFLPAEIAGLMAGEYVGQPVAFDAIHGVIQGEHPVSLASVPVPAASAYVGRRLGDVPVAQMHLILFGVLTAPDRSSRAVRAYFELAASRFHFNPGNRFTLRAGDILVVFGHSYSIRRLREQLGMST